MLGITWTHVVKHVLASRSRTAALAAAVIAVPVVTSWGFRLVNWWIRMRKIRQAVLQFPHRPPHWFYGNLIDNPGPVGDASLKYTEDLANEFPRAYAYIVSIFRPQVTVCHPDTVKVILRTAQPKSTSNFAAYKFFSDWLGNGLIVSTGDVWRRNRKLMTPAFHFDVLKPYMELYNDSADKLIVKWQKAINQDPSVEIYEPVSLCTLEVVMRCAFSYKGDVQNARDARTEKYVKSTISLAGLIVHRLFSLYLYPDIIYNLSPSGRSFWGHIDNIRQMANEIIMTRKEALQRNPEEQKKRYLDFLDILLLARDADGGGLTDQELRQEVDTFLFAGHDTTASAISWCLHTFARHPKEQTKARKEVDAILEGREHGNIEWDDLAQLPYLTMCIKESLRMNPPVPTIERELTEPLELEGHLLPPGTQITISIYGLHHNKTVWGPDHHEFKPERFDLENAKNMDSHAFIAFSAGPRNCIGQTFAMHEVRTIVAKLLHRFQFTVDPNHLVEHNSELIIRPTDGIKLMLTSTA